MGWVQVSRGNELKQQWVICAAWWPRSSSIDWGEGSVVKNIFCASLRARVYILSTHVQKAGCLWQWIAVTPD